MVIVTLAECQDRIRRCRRSIYLGRVQEGFHVTGLSSSSLGELCVPFYWHVRVFGLYSLVDIPYDRLSVQPIPLSGSMDRRSCYRWKRYHIGLGSRREFHCRIYLMTGSTPTAPQRMAREEMIDKLGGMWEWG